MKGEYTPTMARGGRMCNHEDFIFRPGGGGDVVVRKRVCRGTDNAAVRRQEVERLDRELVGQLYPGIADRRVSAEKLFRAAAVGRVAGETRIRGIGGER